MTPDQIKAAYVTSLNEIATLSATMEQCQAAYSDACAALNAAKDASDALRAQLDDALIAGQI